MEFHADGDMVLQRFHGGGEIGIARGPGDGEMELEIGIRPVRLAVRRVAHQFQRPANIDEAVLRVARRRGAGCSRLQRQAKFVAIEKIGNILELAEAERFFQPRALTKLPAPRRE